MLTNPPVGAFSVIVQPVVEAIEHYTALVYLGRPVRRGHVAEVAHVPRALLVLGRSVGTAVGVEVRPSAGAAVSVVAKLEMQIIDSRFIL